MSMYSLLALLLCLGYCAYGIEDASSKYTYLSNQEMEEAVGIDWWNILRADATCCPLNTDKDSCNAEAGSNCVWFPDPNNEIAQAAGKQCVGQSYVRCKRKGGITACCSPSCTGNSAPNFPGGATPPGAGNVPPICGPLTPAPTTPQPTPGDTPSPVTPAPVTPAPTTPAPVAIADQCHVASAAYNLQIILDESGSITADGYDNSVDFVTRLIEGLVNEASPLSVFSFSNAVDELYRFDETQTPRDSILSELDDAKSANGNYQGRCTDTMSALQGALAEYERASNSIGNDLVTGNRFLFLVTDGVPYCGCGLPSSCDPDVCSDDTTSAGYAIRSKIAALGIRLVVLGVGSFDISTIECLADPDDVFTIDGFTDTDFDELVNDVKPILCGSETIVTTAETTVAPILTTPNPTPAPTPKCELGVNYNFEGISCILSGDPHTTMFNGNKHDFQGTPLVVNNGFKRNQFYYIHPCAGESSDDMPLKVAATHYHWGSLSVSGVDYLTIILTEGGGAREYYIYLSSAFASLVDVSATSVSSDYDVAVAAGVGMTDLTSGTVYTVGNRFKVTYTNLQTNFKTFLKVNIDDEMDFTVYMQAQTYSSHSGRYAMHYVQMKVPSGLKCMTCGLCGDFVTYSTGLTTEAMEACDGSTVDYRAGWNPAYTPEAYDTYGWTWEKHFTDNDCSNTYDNTDNIIDTDPKDPCDETIEDDVAAECEAQIEAKTACCTKIGNQFCEGLLKDCKVDACVAANGDVTAIPDAVYDLAIKQIEEVCSNDDLVDDDAAIPPPALECPTGSVVADGGNGYNDISGEGLSSDRYNIGTIEDCEMKCQRSSSCNGFSYAPIGGDSVYPFDTVCSIYSSGTPSQTHGPNQIFCKIVPRTCSLTINSIADDDQWVYRKDGSGSYSQVNSKLGWGQLLTTTMSGVTTNTVVAIEAKNSGGGPGGFIAKVVLSSDDAGITDTYEWVTDNPISTFRVTDAAGADFDPATLSYINLGSTWGTINAGSAPGSAVAGGTWTSIPSGIAYTFYFEPDDFTEKMTALGCVARAKNHNHDKEFVVLHEDVDYKNKDSYYFEAFGIVGLVLILCGAGLYWRKNKNDGYKPIKGIDSEEISPFLQSNKV